MAISNPITLPGVQAPPPSTGIPAPVQPITPPATPVTTQASQPQSQNQPSSLDQNALILTKAIGLQENGGKVNYNALGDSGTSAGQYQWNNGTTKLNPGQIPSNFTAMAQKLGLNGNDFSPTNQNQVAYTFVKSLLDKGMTPAQVASSWNAGIGEPNAYTGKFSNGNASTTDTFDVPGYVAGVQKYAQQLYAQQGVNNLTDPPSTSPDHPANQSPSVAGFLGNVVSSAGNLLSGLYGAVTHPINTVENLASTAAGGIEKLFGGNNQDTQNFDNLVHYFAGRYGGSSIGDVIHNIGHTLYTDPVGAALDLSTLLDGVGAAVGATGKVADIAKAGELAKASDFISTTNGILKSSDPAAVEALRTDGTLTKIANAADTVAKYINPIAPFAQAFTGVANKVSDFTQFLPRRIINNLLPALKNPATIDYATDNLKLGSVDSMLSKSNDSLTSYNDQIQSILTHPDYANTTVNGSDIAQRTLAKFPNSEYTPDTVFAKIKSQIPGSGALVTKLENGSLSLDEANTLRQAIDKVTYKTIIDSPEVRAGKDLASAFGNSLRDQVQTLAPETKPIFSNYSKEINLNKALVKLSTNASKKSVVSMKELMGAIGATSVGGPIAGTAALATEKLLETPAARVAGAKILKNIAVPIANKMETIATKSSKILKPLSVVGRLNNATKLENPPQ